MPRALAIRSFACHQLTRQNGCRCGSIAYVLGAIVGGAFAPLIAIALLQATSRTTAVLHYAQVMTLVSLTVVSMPHDRNGINPSIKNQAEQEIGAAISGKRPGGSKMPASAIR